MGCMLALGIVKGRRSTASYRLIEASAEAALASYVSLWVFMHIMAIVFGADMTPENKENMRYGANILCTWFSGTLLVWYAAGTAGQ